MNSFHIEHVAIAKRHCRDDLANVGDEVFNSPCFGSSIAGPLEDKTSFHNSSPVDFLRM